jgi:hypothetical protein
MKTGATFFFYVFSMISLILANVATADSNQICMHKTAVTSLDSNLNAKMRTEGDSFASINGTPVYFYTDPYSIQRRPNGSAISYVAMGCFDKKILKAVNSIAFRVYWGDGSDDQVTSGSGTQKLTIGLTPERVLCYLHYFVGSANDQSCNETVELTIEQIDPALAAKLREVEENNKRWKEESSYYRTEIEDIEADIQHLEYAIRDRLGKPFADIDLEMWSHDNAFFEIYNIWKDAKKQTDAIKKNTKELLDKAATKEAALKSEILVAFPDSIPVELPTWKLPEVPQLTDGADYTDWGNQWLYSVNSARTSAQIQDILGRFVRSSTAIRKSLQSSPYYLGELRSFMNAFEKVETAIYSTGCGGSGCLSKDGYPKNSQVPQATRKVLRDDLPQIDATAAQQLERQVRAWEGSLTPQQKKVLQLVDALGVAANNVQTVVANDIGNARRTLSSAMQGAVEIAKTTACGVGATLTPGVNDAVDLYEAMYGVNICTGEPLKGWEQVLTGAGLIGGSGYFWRAVGKHVVDVEKVWSKIAVKFTTSKISRTLRKKIIKALEHTPVPPVRMRVGGDKVAIIGRSMGNPKRGLVGVKDARDALSAKGVTAEIFEVSDPQWKKFELAVDDYRKKVGDTAAMMPPDVVKTTDLYSDNAAWAKKLKDENYTVLDLGNPNNLAESSAFYDMELIMLFE